MRTIATKPTTGSWARRAAGALAVLLLLGVPVLAVTSLAPDLLPPASGEGASEAPFPFDAPTASLLRQSPSENGLEANDAANEDRIVLDDWTFARGRPPLVIILKHKPRVKSPFK